MTADKMFAVVKDEEGWWVMLGITIEPLGPYATAVVAAEVLAQALTHWEEKLTAVRELMGEDE